MITLNRSEKSLNAAELAAARVMMDKITVERNRRIQAGFMFQGKLYDFDDASKARVQGAATLAGFAMGQGAQPGDLYWHGGTNPFVWVAADNTLTTMDAQTCFAFGQAAAEHETVHIFAARNLKDMAEIPNDFASDVYWS